MKKIPYYKQETDYSCGAAAMRMVLARMDMKLSEKQLVRLLRTNKAIGTRNSAFSRVAKKFKLSCIAGKNITVSELREHMRNGYMIIICYFYKPEKVYHYAVIKKIDKNRIYFLDPWCGPNHSYTLAHFKALWKSPAKEKNKRWFFAMKK